MGPNNINLNFIFYRFLNLATKRKCMKIKKVEGKILPSGVCDFKEIIDNNFKYVDKTSFIADLLNKKEKVTNILRPRRFGKTLMQSTLKYFFDIRGRAENRELFRGLEIEKSDHFREQGSYPVISLTFKDIRENSWEKCFKKITRLIAKEYNNHRYLSDSECISQEDRKYFCKILKGVEDEVDISLSLDYLSGFLYKHYGKKVVVLIDEYDTPIIEGELEGYYGQVTKFMSNFLSGGLKGNGSLYLGVMTGIIKLSNTGIFSELNNVDFYPITDQTYSDKFGFTTSEVEHLLANYGIENKLEEVKDWYNGYNIGLERIYNPYSLLKYISKGELVSGWLGTSSNELAKKKLKTLLENFQSRDTIKAMEDLYNDLDVEIEPLEDININEVKDIDGILSLLLNGGYLTFEYAGKEGEIKDSLLRVRIPNKEVKAVYKTIQKEILDDRYKDRGFNQLLESIESGTIEEIEKNMKSQLLDASFYDFVGKNLERDYHNFVHGMIRALGDKYEITSNREVGQGRCDILLFPKSKSVKNGIVLEFKAENGDSGNTRNMEKAKKLAKEAVEQIKTKEYVHEIKRRGISGVRTIGFGFVNKEVSALIENC